MRIFLDTANLTDSEVGKRSLNTFEVVGFTNKLAVKIKGCIHVCT